MSKKKNKKKNKNLNKQNNLKNIQIKKIDNNLQEIKKDLKEISEVADAEVTEFIQEQKQNNIETVKENLELVKINNKKENNNKENEIANKILKSAKKVSKIILKLLIASLIITTIYSFLIILSIFFFGLSLAGVGIFSLGIIASIFDITNLITKMGAVACIFVGMGSVCLGIFLMVLIIEVIKKFIIYIKTNFRKVFK